MEKNKNFKPRNTIGKVDTRGQSNWLRAAVLGSNDGIISIAGLVVGVASATQSKSAILIAGLAGIVAGAMSMAAGEYLSVSAQRDTENALLANERKDLVDHPEEELADLVSAYKSEGMDPKIAKVVALELTESNAFATHAEVDLDIDPKHLTKPWSAVFASASSFVVGSLIPLAAVLISVEKYTVVIIFVSVIFALIITGIISAKISGANVFKTTSRVVLGGAIAMIVTYVIGNLFKF